VALPGSGVHVAEVLEDVDSMSFTLDPPMKVGVDYSVEFDNSHSVNLRLVKGKKWSSEPSLLFVKSVTVGKSTHH
jgi:hypothetical protein